MAGHSKWANIKHRKAAQDKKRGKIFTKLIRELTAAVRASGSDSALNPRLRVVIDKALSNNMTRDTIDRAVKRAAGDQGSVVYDEIRYEGYGPGGIAILVECMTDNRNRTVAEVRYAFNKYGGNLGTGGSVAYLFHKQGVLSYSADVDQEQLMDAALETGADDVINHQDGSVDIITNPDNFGSIKDHLEQQGFMTINAQVVMEASNKVLLDKKGAEKFIRLFDALEDLDDVQEVYSNADIPDDILQSL